jgi:hypothetical protein
MYDLKKRINTVPHAGVHVSLGALNMIMQVISECLYEINSLVPVGLRDVVREQYWK